MFIIPPEVASVGKHCPSSPPPNNPPVIELRIASFNPSARAFLAFAIILSGSKFCAAWAAA
jgi:hypothetical protein